MVDEDIGGSWPSTTRYLNTVLASLGDFVQAALGDGAGRVIGVSLVLFFFVLGFLVGYIGTRTRLADEFAQIERDARVQPQVYEGLMHAYLYLPQPAGYERTLSMWKKFEKRFPDAMNERTWTYVACAYGQKYRYISNGMNPDPSALATSEREALHAVRAAIEFNPTAREGLKLLLNGADGGDLLPFRENKQFQELFSVS